MSWCFILPEPLKIFVILSFKQKERQNGVKKYNLLSLADKIAKHSYKSIQTPKLHQL